MVDIAPVEHAKPVVPDEEKAKATPMVKPSGRFVRWLGPRQNAGTIRKISAADWASVNIKADNPAVWNLGNDFRLPAAQFSDRQLDYLLNVAGVNDKGGTFELINADGKKAAR